MNFICKQLTISDDADFGCTIIFSDTVNEGYQENQSLSDLMNPKDKYFLVQRSYPEDFDEDDFYHVETTESEIELSYKDKLCFELNPDRVEIRMAYDVITIGLHLEPEEYKGLRKIINKRFKDFIVLI
jgi:hypothetical protein